MVYIGCSKTECGCFAPQTRPISFAICTCEVMYLAASVLTEQEVCPMITNPEKYIDSKIALQEYNKLTYMKKAKLEAYGYIVEAVNMLDR